MIVLNLGKIWFGMLVCDKMVQKTPEMNVIHW